MRYFNRTTLGELTGLNYKKEVREKARELLLMLEGGYTSEPLYPDELVQRDFSKALETVEPPS